jgi:hypothetical protein
MVEGRKKLIEELETSKRELKKLQENYIGPDDKGLNLID